MDLLSEKTLIYEFVEKGNFHAAMNIAISAMNQCRKDNDQAGVNVCLEIISDITHVMVEAFGS